MVDRSGVCPEPDEAGREPTVAELTAIEAEWPSIEVELALLDVEIAGLLRGPAAAEWAWRRARRLRRQMLVAASQRAGGRLVVAA
ncbi:DUF6284 family protein [Salinispora pacifica]|uniref:DUF6284 family protein n=1 Tax=Salinispora pacifica TaxID=351187 RepID=UPI000373160C|nr:DUF6284 family protein [Salinispora pacifica]